MSTKSKELITTNCIICYAITTIVKGRSHLCPRCKANLAYIQNHCEDSVQKLMDLQIRFTALMKLKRNPKLGITEALRKAHKS